MKPKKSQIFLFDLIFSLVIIIISLGLVFSYFYNPSLNVDIASLNQEIMGSLTQTKINSLNNEEIRQLFIRNEIRNVDNTVAQQISEFYSNGREVRALELSETFLRDFVLQQININVSLYDGPDRFQLYHRSNNNIEFDNAKISSMTRRTVFGYTDLDTSFGPYVFEVRIWQ